ncbi:hypothetical protein VTN77DRAFT_7887 [Rasamsonia byssochlamydoides]|uniref:uncharacterized protein n=1 Tax=Rasamsonia byssochlamydoides TaxID=89139 RepID=UPI003743BF84
MPPSKTIVIFGDNSIPVHVYPALSQLLLVSQRENGENSLLAQFLTRSSAVLRDGVAQLRRKDREGLPSFAAADLLELMRHHHHHNNDNAVDNDNKDKDKDNPDNQILSPALLVLVQLGQFIAWYENHPEVQYPDASSSSIIIGLCIGQLSATAVSLANSLVELLPLAVEAVRVAFQVGAAVTSVRNELEPDDEGGTWAMSLSEGLINDEVMRHLQESLALPNRKKAYITAEFAKSVTVQGPPSTLSLVERWFLDRYGSSPPQGCRNHRIPIYAPYHARHLYSETDILRIIDSYDSLQQTYHTHAWSEQQQPQLISPVTGSSYIVTSRRDVLKQALREVLLEPIHWTKLVGGCISRATASGCSNWTVRPFGPIHSAGKNLVASLRAEAHVQVLLDDSCSNRDPPQSAIPAKVPIAIVGMAGRFPEADSHDELWKLLVDGVDCHKVIPTDRFNPNIYVSTDLDSKNKSGTPYGNFMKNPGMFDARFFNMSPREAAQTDPQQRLALVTAYEALEMAGYVPNRTPSTQLDRVGTFYGQTTDDYKDVNIVQDIDTYYVSGVVRAFGPGRVSRSNKLGGPSLSVDTACSSSAMALNLACSSIWSGECDTAVVGGMMLLNSPDMFAGLTRGHFVSQTGPCMTFDNEADGYCRGETVASVVLKRLDAAHADNDKILGVILGAVTNYSAYAASITQPHGPTQEMLYTKVLLQAGVHPFDVDYVEMHGTGTQLGDAIEMSSVSNIFAPASPVRPADQPLYIGSVKANIGHGESASGIAALIKTLLIFREQRLPPHVGIKSGVLNRTFPDLKQRNIRIPMEVTAFPCRQRRQRRAMINNFGAAGGNSAFILEEAPEDDRDDSIVDSRPDHVISVTAKSRLSLERNIQNLVEYLDKNPQVSLSDLAYTTTARRIQHPLRVSLVASTVAQVKNRLSSSALTQPLPGRYSNVVFAFTGQGTLYRSVGKELFELSEQFKTDLLRFDRISRDHGFPSFLAAIDGSVSDFDSLSPVQTQLTLTAIQMALSRLWSSWRVEPGAVIGHSLGEYAALYAAGVLSASDTLYLLACINGPSDVVLSGVVESVENARQVLKSQGIKCTVLDVPFAFHSSQVDPILAPFEKAAQHIKFSTPKIPVISTLLGTVVRDAGVLGPSYMRRHAREPVRFLQALEQCRADGLVDNETIWLELGPNPVCLGMITTTLGNNNKAVRGVPTLRRTENPWRTICKALSFLHDHGVDIDWTEYHRDFERGQELLHIPTYAFGEKNYWIEYKNDWLLKRTGEERLVSEEVLDGRVSLVFETDLSEPAMNALIAGHSLNGLALCPSGVFADMALTVSDYVRREHQIRGPDSGLNIVNMEIMKPVTVGIPRSEEPQPLRIHAVADLHHGHVDIQIGTYDIRTRRADRNATCRVEFGDASHWLDVWSRTAYLVQERIKDLERGVSSSKISRAMAYNLFSTIVDYDPRYQGMQEVLVNSEKLEATASLKLYEGHDAGTFFCSPLLLDNLAQLAGFVLNAIGVVDPRQFVYISHGMGSYQLGKQIDPRLPYKVHVRMLPVNKTVVAGDVSIFQGDTMIGKCGGVKFQKVPRSLLATLLAPPATSSNMGPSRLKVSKPPAAAAARKSASAELETTSTTSRRVMDILADQIGIAVDELSDGSSFAELGVDSLLSLTILSQLRESLQLELPATAFQDFSTVGELQRFIQKSREKSDDDDVFTPISASSISRPLTPAQINGQEAAVVDDDLLDSVHSVIAEQIGVDVEELLATDDLSALGLDSLMSLSIIGALNEQLGLSLAPNAIGGEVSLKQIQKALNLPSPERTRPAAKAPLLSLPSATSVLLQANPKTASKTIFFFPEGSGAATAYASLPEISPGVCVFALNSPFLKAAHLYTGSISIEDTAAIMVREVRQRQPQGPYILAGWSAGGMYAFEAARQLSHAGERVSKLILIDSPCRVTYGPMPLDVLDLMTRSGVLFGQQEKPPSWLVEHFQATIRAIQRYAPAPLPAAHTPPTVLIWATEGLGADIDLSVLDSREEKITKWLIERERAASGDSPPEPGHQGWEKLIARDCIEMATVPGNHFSMMRESNAARLSRVIADVV